MIKLILFDLGGVVFTNGTKLFIADMAAKYNLPPADLEAVFDGDIGTQYREGKINRDKFWQEVLKNLPFKESADELEKDWVNHYDLIPGMKELIWRLSRQYQVMYLSDNVRERVENLDERFKFLHWFEGGIFSHEVGVRKPNPKIYKLALQAAGVTAPEAIFIDDKPKNLTPAKALGMKVILFESAGQLKHDLDKLY
ncbi:MAG TPA: HAD family phosphatase [Patescibacteria group bacterium]|nr:HAD family phosphatase [Patescibacteria group bacterium]